MPLTLDVTGVLDGQPIPGDFAFCVPAAEGHVAMAPNRNPRVAWRGAPAATKSFAVLCIDADAPTDAADVNRADRTVPASLARGAFSHWVLVDIPGSATAIAEGADSDGVTAGGKPVGPTMHGVRGRNDYTAWFADDPDMAGTYGGYDGPCPPWNDELVHHYTFSVYALDVATLGLSGPFGASEVLAAIDGHVLDSAAVTGTYTLNPALGALNRMMAAYDEFSMLEDNASEAGLAWSGRPAARRESVTLSNGKRLSALVWGTGSPELVLLHGGAQNAHTWDTVALALDTPLLAIDLPGHGHSDWRDEHDYWPPSMADDVAVAIATYAPDARAVVGMSLGGLTAICLAAQHPHLVRRLGIVDVTPGTDHKKAEGIVAFISGPEYFESFDAILARTIEHNPTRTESSLRRGVLHNARELDDGRWSWRYDPARGWKAASGNAEVSEYFAPLWDAVDAVRCPITLYLGARSPVVGPEDVVELQRRQPTTEVHTVADAGHSIQGDRPVELARRLAELVAR